MKNFNVEKGIEQLKKVQMTAMEKSAILKRILEPLPRSVPSPWTLYSFKVWIERNRLVAVVTVIVLTLAVSGANITFAAKGSLPGDLLYPIKTDVIEPTEGALAVTPAAQAKFNASVANTRLQEAQTLAAQGNLDPAKEQEIQTSFNSHVSALSTALDKLNKTDATSSEKIRASFKSDMNSAADVLDALTSREVNNNYNNLANHPNNHAYAVAVNATSSIYYSSSTLVKTSIATHDQFSSLNIAKDARAAGDNINHTNGNHVRLNERSIPVNSSINASSTISASSTTEIRGANLLRSNSRSSFQTGSPITATSSAQTEATSEPPFDNSSSTQSQSTHSPYQNFNPPLQNVQSIQSQSQSQRDNNNSKSSSNSASLNSAAATEAPAVSGSINNIKDKAQNIVHGL